MSLENQFNQLFKQHTWKLKQCTNGHRPTFLICCTAVAFPPLLEVGSFLSKPRNSPDVPNSSWFANTFSGGIPRIDATGFRTSYSVNNLQYKRRILIYNVFCTFNWQMISERKKKVAIEQRHSLNYSAAYFDHLTEASRDQVNISVISLQLLD